MIITMIAPSSQPSSHVLAPGALVCYHREAHEGAYLKLPPMV
jgi:hypothetical protein